MAETHLIQVANLTGVAGADDRKPHPLQQERVGYSVLAVGASSAG